MIAQAPFDLLAKAYHLLADPARVARELPWLGAHIPLGCRVLDLGCGDGAHVQALSLARKLALAVGLDASQAMIERARAQAGSARFCLGNLLQPPPGPWDRVLLWGNAGNCRPPRVRLAAWLTRLRRVLAPGGQLLVQARLPPAGPYPVQQVVRRRSHGLELEKQLTFDDTQCCLELRVRSASEHGWQEEHSQQYLACTSKDQWLNALAHAGYQLVSCHGDVNGSPCHDKSTDIILCAQGDSP